MDKSMIFLFTLLIHIYLSIFWFSSNVGFRLLLSSNNWMDKLMIFLFTLFLHNLPFQIPISENFISSLRLMLTISILVQETLLHQFDPYVPTIS